MVDKLLIKPPADFSFIPEKIRTTNMNKLNPTPSVDDPLLISAEQLAALLNISTRTLWRLRSAGKIIAPVRLGGNTRWRFHEVYKWIEQGCPTALSGEQLAQQGETHGISLQTRP